MGGEDHGAGVDPLKAGETVVLVDEVDAVLLQLVGDVLVMDQVAKHVDGLWHSLGPSLGAQLASDLDGVDDAMAVASRGDFDDLHRLDLRPDGGRVYGGCLSAPPI